MDFTQEFQRAWQAEFPELAHPCHEKLCACLAPASPGTADSSVSSVSSIASIPESRMTQIEELCVQFTAEAERLENEARQKRFVANFLDRLLLKLARTPDSESSSPTSPHVQRPLLRGTKYSLVSPMVPRGTLHKVKDALRQSGMLLDSSEEGEEGEEGEEETAGEEDEKDGYSKALGERSRVDEAVKQAEEEKEEEGAFKKLARRPAYVSRGKGKHQPPLPSVPCAVPSSEPHDPGEDPDNDSLDDYLYDSLTDGEEERIPGSEEISNRVSSKPFHGMVPTAPADAEPVEQQSNVYVSVEAIRRRKHHMSQIAPTAAASPGSGSASRTRTLHDRLSYVDSWKNRDSTYEMYEQLSETSCEVNQRRGRDRGGGEEEEKNRHGVACASDMTRVGEEEEDPYEVANEDEEFTAPGDGDLKGTDLSASAVTRRLARAHQRPFSAVGQTLEQQQSHQQQQRLQGVPWQFDHAMMLRDAQGDSRRQELIHILKSEETHLQLLEIMNGYHRIFLAYKFPTQKVEVIFSRVAELRTKQEKFVTMMAGRLNDWKPNSTISDVISSLYDYQVLKDYITNLPTALKAFEELIAERKDIAERLEVIMVQGKSIMFRDLLQQPVVWLTKSSENMKRMIEHTPSEHPDHDRLEELLNQLLGLVKSGSFGGPQKDRAVSVVGMSSAENGGRTLVRHSLLVELTTNGSQRKIRHVFLFSDMLVCAKPRVVASTGSSFEVRWVIPISQVVIYKVTDTQTDEMRSKRKAEIETLKHRIKDLRNEIKKEVDKDGLRSSFRRWNWAPGRRGVDKLKEQLHKAQAQLVLASPNLEFKISSSNEKKHSLLMSSEFERREWTDSIMTLKSAADKSNVSSNINPSMSEVQILLEDYKDMVSVNKLGSCLLHDGQEGVISGILKVTIHRVEGLKEPINCIVCVEVDSFEHFDLFAKTTPVGPSCDPVMNQEFDIELEFSTTVRFIVCQESVDAEGRASYQNIAKLELRLDIDSLSHYVETPHGLATFADPSHSILLTLSLAYQATYQTLARQMSDRRAGLFGVPLEKVVRREVLKFQRGQDPPIQVPLIVRACTNELDNRALDEPGIYRISGMNADVAKLKASFDQNVSATSRFLEGYEVHVISGVLKAYLRELPEPLFTVERYRDFMDAFELAPIEVKREEFIRLLNGLPEPNLSTARHLLRHFARINKNSEVNKMVAGNLGLIFGPTLLSPASSVLPCDILSVTMESFKQSGTLTFMIALTTEGRIFAD